MPRTQLGQSQRVRRALVLLHDAGQVLGPPVGKPPEDEVEVEGQVAPGLVVAHELGVGKVDLPHHHPLPPGLGELVQDLAHLPHVGVGLRLVLGEDVEVAAPVPHARAPVGVSGLIPKEEVLGEKPEDVHPEAVHPASEPEAHHLVNGLPHLGVSPVEVGLLGEELVEVVLARRLVQGPGGAAEEALPVVGGAAVRGGVFPDVPVPLGAVPGGAGLQEPGVLAGGVVRHQVHEDLKPQGVGLL